MEYFLIDLRNRFYFILFVCAIFVSGEDSKNAFVYVYSADVFGCTLDGKINRSVVSFSVLFDFDGSITKLFNEDIFSKRAKSGKFFFNLIMCF